MASPKVSSEYDFDAGIELIIEQLKSYYPAFLEHHEKKVRKAYWYGYEAHIDQTRFSGEPYFMHPIEATKILLTIRPDIDTVCACLLHDVIEDTPITAEDIEAEFGPDIRFLCEGVEKVSKVNLREDQGKQKLQTLKKLFLAVAKDIRVIFVKLADRIHNLETLHHVRSQKRLRIAKESLKIYAPVAQKLGLFDFKIRIEDLCFEHLHPAPWAIIRDELDAHFAEQETFIRRAKTELAEHLRKKQITVLEINGRRKNIASIYEKMKRKNLTSVSEIYDLVGFRIVLKKDSTCYRALGALHSQWTPMPGRFKDYISVPKQNGYQSLHTTILGLAGSSLPTEIQIRTQKMQLDAEYGPAAHWAYKTKRSSNFDADYVRRTEWFPTAIRPEESKEKNADDFFTEFTEGVLDDRIYVFTPKGDPISLRAGSTPVDFAYAVHTQVGDTIVGAKINGVMKPIHTPLEGGQIIEVLTRKGQTPKESWLEFVKSSAARQNINNFINKERRKENPNYDPSKYRSKLEELKKEIPKAKKENSNKPITPEKKVVTPGVLIGGEKGIPHKIAPCCTPQPGEHLIAYKSRGLSFMLHKSDCSELRSLNAERMLEAGFLQTKGVTVKAQNRIGLIRDILDVIAAKDLNVTDMRLDNSTPLGVPTSHVFFRVEVLSNDSWQELLAALKKMQGTKEIIPEVVPLAKK